MLTTIKKTANKFVTLSCPQRGYAAVAGKYKYIPPNNYEFDKHLINQHAQYITDFNIIYENPKDIQLFSIGTLHTTPEKNSSTISYTQNYRFQNKPQQIQYHQKPLHITDKLNIIKNSKKYFDDIKVKENIEKVPQYKAMFTNVMEELKAKGIKFRIAQNREDFSLTGFNVFLKMHLVIPKNDLLETLDISQNNDK